MMQKTRQQMRCWTVESWSQSDGEEGEGRCVAVADRSVNDNWVATSLEVRGELSTNGVAERSGVGWVNMMIQETSRDQAKVERLTSICLITNVTRDGCSAKIELGVQRREGDGTTRAVGVSCTQPHRPPAPETSAPRAVLYLAQ